MQVAVTEYHVTRQGKTLRHTIKRNEFIEHNPYIVGDWPKVNQSICGLNLRLARVDPFVHRQQQICIHGFQFFLDDLVCVADKQRTNRLVIRHMQGGRAVVQHGDISIHAGTSPQDAIAPGRRAELLVRSGIVQIRA